MEEAVAARIRANPDYVELEASRRSFGWTLTIIMLVVYYGFLAVVAFVPSIIPQPLFGNVTVGIILGLGVIVTAILLTGLYVVRANSRFDVLSRRIVAANAALVRT